MVVGGGGGGGGGEKKKRKRTGGGEERTGISSREGEESEGTEEGEGRGRKFNFLVSSSYSSLSLPPAFRVRVWLRKTTSGCNTELKGTMEGKMPTNCASK